MKGVPITSIMRLFFARGIDLHSLEILLGQQWNCDRSAVRGGARHHNRTHRRHGYLILT